MTLSARLKLAREKAGLSQKALGKISGVSQQMISKLESGRSESTGDLVALAAALGTTAEYLSGSVENSKPQLGRRVIPVMGSLITQEDGTAILVEESERFISTLSRDKNAYALAINGDGIYPRYKDGDEIVVEPMTQPLKTTEVVVFTTDNKWLIREYMLQSGDSVFFKDVNNRQKVYEMNKNEIVSIHYICESRPKVIYQQE